MQVKQAESSDILVHFHLNGEIAWSAYVVWAQLIKKKLTIDNIRNTILKAHSIYLALLEFYTTLFYFII